MWLMISKLVDDGWRMLVRWSITGNELVLMVHNGDSMQQLQMTILSLEVSTTAGFCKCQPTYERKCMVHMVLMDYSGIS